MAQPRGSFSASLQESRFADEYVRREYKVKDLLGSRGDGFCFDTNSIHAGTLNGSRTRGAVVFEFNQYAKSVGLSSLDSPCRVVPTSKGWTPTWHRPKTGTEQL